MHSLSAFFHPAYLAAAYLACARKNVEELNPKFDGLFSDKICGNSWFLFVDPNINEIELQFVTECLKDEVAFLQSLWEKEDPVEETQEESTFADNLTTIAE